MAESIKASTKAATIVRLAVRIGATMAAMLCAGSGTAQREMADACIDRGRQHFTYWCAACHGSGPGHGGTTALAFKYRNSKPALLEERTDLDVTEVTYFVRHGVSIMPFFRKTELSDRDLADIAAYLTRAPGRCG